MSEAIATTCIRGCTAARKHATDCPGDECKGCLPRPAQHGLLCYGCHSRLRNLVRSIHVQWALLIATAGKSTSQVLTAETIAKTHQQPRTSTGQAFPAPFAKGSPSAGHSEPIRAHALDAAQGLSDWLSCVVEGLCEEHDLTGPARLRSGNPDPRQWKWRGVDEHGAGVSDFDPLVTYRDERETMRGQYLLTEPPARFEVRPAMDFLLAWLDRLESVERVADEMETLSELMSQAHSLAPWRESVVRVPGIPCPECHACTLVRFGGDEDITCLQEHCRTMLPPGRYGIWVRQLADEHREKGA